MDITLRKHLINEVELNRHYGTDMLKVTPVMDNLLNHLENFKGRNMRLVGRENEITEAIAAYDDSELVEICAS